MPVGRHTIKTRAIVDHVNVSTIGLIDRLVAIAVTTTIAATPRRLLARPSWGWFLAAGPTRDPVSEGGVDGAGAEHVIQDHCGATDYAGLGAVGGGGGCVQKPFITLPPSE